MKERILLIVCIIFTLCLYGFYLSKSAENKCIQGANKESKTGQTTEEIIKWCKEVF